MTWHKIDKETNQISVGAQEPVVLWSIHDSETRVCKLANLLKHIILVLNVHFFTFYIKNETWTTPISHQSLYFPQMAAV